MIIIYIYMHNIGNNGCKPTSVIEVSVYCAVFFINQRLCCVPGWIVQKGREDELAQEAILEWCIQTLQQARKLM